MFAYCFNNPVNMVDSGGNWPEWVETAAKIASVALAVAAVVVTVVAISAVSSGTATPAAIFAATAFLSATLSGINGAIANESNGNSYLNGYVGGYIGGGTQAVASQFPGGNVWGGFLGSSRGTAITKLMNNWDPDSSDSSLSEIISESVTSGCKAAITGSVTEFIGIASNLAVEDVAYGLLPGFTPGFAEAIKAFFSWVDDAIVYVWE